MHHPEERSQPEPMPVASGADEMRRRHNEHKNKRDAAHKKVMANTNGTGDKADEEEENYRLLMQRLDDTGLGMFSVFGKFDYILFAILFIGIWYYVWVTKDINLLALIWDKIRPNYDSDGSLAGWGSDPAVWMDDEM